jgi:hypothetical protein
MRPHRSAYAAHHHDPELAPARLVARGSGGGRYPLLGVGQPRQPGLDVAYHPNLVARPGSRHALRE